jgi:hypothetical protein
VPIFASKWADPHAYIFFSQRDIIHFTEIKNCRKCDVSHFQSAYNKMLYISNFVKIIATGLYYTGRVLAVSLPGISTNAYIFLLVFLVPKLIICLII